MKDLKISAGVFFYCASTNRYLYLLRNDPRNNNWALPGGGIEAGETLLDGIRRECMEELGMFPDWAKLIPLQKFTNKNFVYHTFWCKVQHEFVPNLNHEHCGFAWVGAGSFPKPLHPGLFSTMNLDDVQQKLQTLADEAALEDQRVA